MIVAAAEQRAEDRQVLEAGEAVDVLARVLGEQAGERQRAARRQLDRRVGLALLQGRDLNAREHHGALVGELADLGLDLEADAALRQHDRREGEADAELLVDDARLAEAVDDGDRVFAAGEELGGLAGDRREVRLGQRPQQAVALEGAQGAVDGLIARLPAGGDARVAEAAPMPAFGSSAPVTDRVEADRAPPVVADAGDGQRAECGRGQRQRVVGEDGGGEVAGVDERADVDAELLQDRCAAPRRR